ncbi:hypothetical protein HPP92_019998 [Vanilla planifolia]|uniref:Chloroplast envelope membrane protein n=1 Tax=Vanilla planifolia TaxID=51239 RepID=A0A835UJV1_VANPL|nr:hypothetical protein HPP92_019998 [Vanilla planifolia]
MWHSVYALNEHVDGFLRQTSFAWRWKICQRVSTLWSIWIFEFSSKRKRVSVYRLVPAAKRNHARKRPWWESLFSEEDDDVLSIWKGVDVLGDTEEVEEVSCDEKFESWKRRAEAITELKDAQEDARNAESREWEDWIGDDSTDAARSSWYHDFCDAGSKAADEFSSDQYEMLREKSFIDAAKKLISGSIGDELFFEDKVFQYASTSSAKFIALIVIIPWAVGFLVHDYILMPFLDRQQKLEMVKSLRVAKARYRLEVEIGKSPPLSDEDVWLELRHKAIELRDEFRLENRRAFANIWSDMVYGVVLFILIYSNKSKVALLEFTGYHSEFGWHALAEIIMEHYGFEVDEAVITIFIAIFPVAIDIFVKLWLFKFLPRLSPNVAIILRKMQRH